MAFHWRIRHKLIVGLGLVVAIIALLLAGTFKGLMSYVATMKTVDSKLAELQAAEKLEQAVKQLDQPGKTDNGFREDAGDLQAKSKLAQEALRGYEDQLQETLLKRRDPDQGFHERQIIDALDARFRALDKALEKASDPQIRLEQGTVAVRNEPAVKNAINELVSTSGDLHAAVYKDLYDRISASRGQVRGSFWMVVSTSLVGVLLMAGLLRFFYGWVFYPIHDLQQGAGLVAQGDFDHRIEVHSGDEMEELAAAFNDMTGRLREMYRDLARQVNERSRQLVRSERLASVGFLAAGVAHEINNPLASIAFCSEALEARLTSFLRSGKPARPASEPRILSMRLETQGPKTDEEIVVKYLKMIQQEAFRCKAITQKLLEFSRSGERLREPVDLGDLAQSVLDMVQHLQNCKGKHIIFEPAGRVVAAVNAQEIKSVVLNLVVNALDSMEDGGQLTIKLSQRAGMAELVFTDTGCGMTEEVLENIFEPFFTRSRTGKGTGLGLTISHRIITQHGGEIEAASPGPNQGSTFTVRVPLQPAEPIKEETLGHAAA